MSFTELFFLPRNAPPSPSTPTSTPPTGRPSTPADAATGSAGTGARKVLPPLSALPPSIALLFLGRKRLSRSRGNPHPLPPLPLSTRTIVKPWRCCACPRGKPGARARHPPTPVGRRRQESRHAGLVMGPEAIVQSREIKKFAIFPAHYIHGCFVLRNLGWRFARGLDVSSRGRSQTVLCCFDGATTGGVNHAWHQGIHITPLLGSPLTLFRHCLHTESQF